MTHNFPSSSFSASLPDLLIEGVTQDYAVVSFTANGTAIYSEVLYPDTSGRISVLSISRMITQFMRRRSLLQMSLVMAITPKSGSTTSKTCTVYYISSIGALLARGASISALLVLTLLPALLSLFDRFLIKRRR